MTPTAAKPHRDIARRLVDSPATALQLDAGGVAFLDAATPTHPFHSSTMNQTRIITTTAVAVLLVASLVGAAATPAAADHEDGESFFDPLAESINGISKTVIEATANVASKASKSIAGLSTDETNATDDLNAFADVYNQNNATIENHANDRVSTDSNHTSFRLTCTDTEDREATMYLIGDYNPDTDAYENTRIVDEQTFQDTGRTVDGYVDGDWYICSNAADELEHYVDNYAEPGDDLTGRYYGDMMRKYASSVDSDLWGEV